MTNPQTVEILRDTWGVPHIYASTEEGAHPTTDGGPFDAAGVPLVNYLTAPLR